jgi:hypothetical protein
MTAVDHAHGQLQICTNSATLGARYEWSQILHLSKWLYLDLGLHTQKILDMVWIIYSTDERHQMNFSIRRNTTNHWIFDIDLYRGCTLKEVHVQDGLRFQPVSLGRLKCYACISCYVTTSYLIYL